jgi:hypothetical protein
MIERNLKEKKREKKENSLNLEKELEWILALKKPLICNLFKFMLEEKK